MNIYLIGSKQEFETSVDILANVGKVIILDSGDKEIEKYSILFSDKDPKIIGVAPGVIDWKFPLEVIKRISNLKGICTKSSWGYFIDIEYCRQNNISVCNIPGANSRSVAEYAFWQMLSVSKNLPQQISENFKTKHDEMHYQTEITGKTVGIIGLGKVGAHFASMAKGFDMNVIYTGRAPKDVGYRFVSVEELLKESDFIINCIETCPETKNYLNKERLCLMKPTAFFISVMGGAGWGVEDDNFLVEMVETGKLAGFSVENEHQGEFNTKQGGNIFVPASYAWYTTEAKDRSNKMFTETMSALATGNVINEIK